MIWLTLLKSTVLYMSKKKLYSYLYVGIFLVKLQQVYLTSTFDEQYPMKTREKYLMKKQ